MLVAIGGGEGQMGERTGGASGTGGRGQSGRGCSHDVRRARAAYRQGGECPSVGDGRCLEVEGDRAR